MSSEPNIASARALANSVLPTPVGPEKIKLPIGLFGDFKPTLARLIALEIDTTASLCPITRLCRISSNFISRSLSPSVKRVTGTPVIIAITSATSSSDTTGLFASLSFFHCSATSRTLSFISASSSRNEDAFSNSWLRIASSFSLTISLSFKSSSRASGHRVETFSLTFELASSNASIALSGKNLSVTYFAESFVAAITASSEIINSWWSSYLDFSPRIISIVSSIDGSSIITD